MFAIRSRRKSISEKDFLDAVQKVRVLHCLGVSMESPALTLLHFGVPMCGQVIKSYKKFSSTPKYMVYN